MRWHHEMKGARVDKRCIGEIKLEEDSQMSIVLCLQNAPGYVSKRITRVGAKCSGLSDWE